MVTGALPFPTLNDIQVARERLKGVAQRTPVDDSLTFSLLSHNTVYLKLENLQKTGSFKIRGAFNKIASLDPEDRAKGIVAASAGNHAQGVAFAAAYHHVPCTIVMPESASLAKIAATQQYGATVVLAGNTYDDAADHAIKLQQTHDFTFVHAFDDPMVVAGQATIGLEILEQLPTTNAIVVPVGGGGLAGGIGLAVKSMRPDIKVYGVEAAAAACFTSSLAAGCVQTVPAMATMADGIAVHRPGELTYRLAQQYLDRIVTVEEEEIARSMVLLMERCKLVTEGAAAAAVAPLIYGKLPAGMGNVVVVVSGGNIDVLELSKIVEHGLVEAGRFLRLEVKIEDRPGALRDLLGIIAEVKANVQSVQHRRVGSRISYGETEVEIDLETRDKSHIERIVQVLDSRGYRPLERE